MSTQNRSESVPRAAQTTQWSFATRVTFRFCFVYLGLFCLTTQIVTSLFSPSQGAAIPDPATVWPMRQIVLWTAAHVFHTTATLSLGGNSASGDDTFGWILSFCLLIFALLSTAAWSLLDRKRENYVELHKWFRLSIRFFLAGQMINYGLDKVIPLQMSYPDLDTLVEPFGSFSPMGVLWSFMGASPAYEIFTGCAETLGGLLLIVPRTATFGALLCLADMTQVFMLNMTYDVPVKLFSFHLILLALFLLISDFHRLVNLFFLNRVSEPSTQTQLFRTRRANQAALTAQILVGLWLLGMNGYYCRELWYAYGGGRPKSPLYGIWQVSQMSIDDQLRPLAETDVDRWRNVIFDYPTLVTFQRMDGSFVFYRVSIDVNKGILALTALREKNWNAHFAFQRVGQDRLTLDGKMDSHTIHMQLQIIDRDKFLLVSRGFHWIQEEAFDR
jgi:uncharacterized membrane protein YphA (DoxX/SURF4 family)